MRKTSLVLAVLLAVAGICVMLWPVFTGHKLQADTNEAVQSFLEERKPEQQYPELLVALQEYNRQIYAEKQCNLTDLEACEEPAADLPAYGIDDEIIGVLAIPVIELTMPVYLGASDAHLAAGAAVLGNCETLYYYLTCGRSLKDTCEMLLTHRNTVLYRIHKMREDFDVSLDDPTSHTELLLSTALTLLDSKGATFFINSREKEVLSDG